VKPHTAVKVVPTPSGNDGSLQVEVTSAGLSRPFGCCPRFQNDEICVGIRVSVRGGSHTVSDQASMGASGPLENLFCSNRPSRRGQCERERSRDAASKCTHV
jgi:hypothetical protein